MTLLLALKIVGMLGLLDYYSSLPMKIVGNEAILYEFLDHHQYPETN